MSNFMQSFLSVPSIFLIKYFLPRVNYLIINEGTVKFNTGLVGSVGIAYTRHLFFVQPQATGLFKAGNYLSFCCIAAKFNR